MILFACGAMCVMLVLAIIFKPPGPTAVVTSRFEPVAAV